MITNKRITIMADSIINDAKIATHSASLTLGEAKMSMTSQYLDKDACEANLEAVKNDQQDFENYVHSLYLDDALYS